MFTFTEFNNSATIYSGDTSIDDWTQLIHYLSENKLQQVYFHYVYFSPSECGGLDLLSALSKATNLKSILLKGSTFYFTSPDGQRRENGLGKLLDSLHSHPNLEHLQIRNYESYELDAIFKNLVDLLDNNKSIKKLSLWHLKIDSTKFRLLCDLLSKPEVELELDLEWAIELSEENKNLLKRVLQVNPSIKVSDNVIKMLDTAIDEEANDEREFVDSNLNFLILSGCLGTVGIAAIAIAFTVLNAATLGTAGLVVAGIGVASIIAGIGLFAYDRYKANEDRPNSNLEMEPSLSFIS